MDWNGIPQKAEYKLNKVEQTKMALMQLDYV